MAPGGLDTLLPLCGNLTPWAPARHRNCRPSPTATQQPNQNPGQDPLLLLPCRNLNFVRKKPFHTLFISMHEASSVSTWTTFWGSLLLVQGDSNITELCLPFPSPASEEATRVSRNPQSFHFPNKCNYSLPTGSPSPACLPRLASSSNTLHSCQLHQAQLETYCGQSGHYQHKWN